MNIERTAGRLSGRGGSRQGYFVLYRQSVVGEQKFGSENPVEVEEASDKVGLPMHQLPGDDPRRLHDPSPAEMFAIERLLGGYQLVIELGSGSRVGNTAC